MPRGVSPPQRAVLVFFRPYEEPVHALFQYSTREGENLVCACDLMTPIFTAVHRLETTSAGTQPSASQNRTCVAHFRESTVWVK